MPPAPETASAPSTCSGSSLRSVEPKCSCPSNQSPVKPRPSAASRISPKGEANVVVTTSGSFQNSANIIPRTVQTTPIDPKVTQSSRRAAPQLPHDPKVTQSSRRNAPQLPAAPHSPQRRQARSAEAAAGTRARNSRAPPHQPSGPNQQRPHRRLLAAESPQAGAGLSFQNTPQTSVAPCPRLRRSRTRRHTWSRTF